MTPKAALWQQWLVEIAEILRGTSTSEVAAELWAETVGLPSDAESFQDLTRRVLMDEQCGRMGRVNPGDVRRLLVNEVEQVLPGADQTIREIWEQVSRVGSYAAVDGFEESIVRFSHPIIAAVAATVGWMELCTGTERGVLDGQMRRYYDTIAGRWTRGYVPAPPRGLRCEIAEVPMPPGSLNPLAGVPLVGVHVEAALPPARPVRHVEAIEAPTGDPLPPKEQLNMLKGVMARLRDRMRTDEPGDAA